MHFFFIRKSEAMSRPKKEFIPTSLSDLNIDTLSLGSNGDRHNNNSNGAGLNSLNRSKATSSFNLASNHTPYQSNNNPNSTFSRSSKMYGSQSSIHSSNHQSVNNYNLNSQSSSVDRWEQAWEENQNSYRPPSYQQQQREHSFEKSNKPSMHSYQSFNNSNSINQNQVISNRSMNHYVDDPFDDPWSGILNILFCYLWSLHKTAPTHAMSEPIIVFGDGNMNESARKEKLWFFFLISSKIIHNL